MSTRWVFKPEPGREAASRLAGEIGIDPLLAGLLVQRGIRDFESARRFFRPELSHLHDPMQMQDMEQAVDRLEDALTRGERILVYGDYDVDGTTSVALMAAYLRKYSDAVATYIPDRYREGYGLSRQGIEFADDNGMGLIVALDCGVKAIEQARYARSKGIDLIICDHHRPGETLPEAVAVLDPKRDDCPYPYKELCGCGVGFKLIQALHERRGLDPAELLPYLDLVATAIGADIVPITGENRVMVHYGLQVINGGARPGIRALLRGLDRKNYQVSDLVFRVAPRINAAGRMQHGEDAVRLLTETDPARAGALADEIESLNSQRRETEQAITDEALEMVRSEGGEARMSTVVFKEDWHKGVIGIVASRLIETYYRPTLVFTRSGDKLAASARSVRGFDLYEALEACSDCIEQFGGHTYAAGLTLEASRFQDFKDRFEKVVSERITEDSLTPEIQIDLKIHLSQIHPKLVRILSQFGPFGPGNPAPVFVAGPLVDTGYARTVGEGGAHLKLAVTQDGSGPIGGIGFGLGDRLDLIQGGREFYAVFSIEENHWQGRTSTQLKIRDIRDGAPD